MVYYSLFREESFSDRKEKEVAKRKSRMKKIHLHCHSLTAVLPLVGAWRRRMSGLQAGVGAAVLLAVCWFWLKGRMSGPSVSLLVVQ